MTKRRAKRYLVNFVLNGAAGFALFFGAQYTFYSLTPTSLYFEYDSVEILERNGDELSMESILRNPKEGNMYWNDVLRCIDTNGTFSYFSQVNTSAELIKENNEYYISLWPYRGELPATGKCRISSTITRELDFGIKKTQYIESNIIEL